MNPRWGQLAWCVSWGIFVWTTCSFAHRVHWLLGPAIALIAACNIVATWMLRHHPERLQTLSDNRLLKTYLGWVCRATGEQLPTGPSSEHGGEFLLTSDSDFRAAAWRARQVVMGHDRIIDLTFRQIREAVRLRKQLRDGSVQPPLASFLLVGRDGIGKRYLARVIARLLYSSGSVHAIDCGQAEKNAQFGSLGVAKELVESVRRQPFQLVLVERVEAAGADLIELLLAVLSRGTCLTPGTGRPVSFQNTTIVMTTSSGLGPLQVLANKPLPQRAWDEKAAEIVASEAGFGVAFVNAIGEIVVCDPPSEEVKAQVAALLMIRECRVHGITLTQVDPQVIATEVLRIDDGLGFGSLPRGIKRLLHKPILAASDGGYTSLRLCVRVPEPIAGENHA